MPIFLMLLISFALKARTFEASLEKYSYENAPEFQAIMTKIKSLGEFVTKDGGVEKKAVPMSRGEQMVEEAKARNRAILAARNAADKKAEEEDSKKSVHEQWRDEVQKTHEGWKKEIAETRKQWKREQDIFLGRIKDYQETTFEIPAPKMKIVEIKVPKERLPDVHVVKDAFSIPVRDQRKRPTCAAFAGIRAVEILLAQNNEKQELSPQYFYWASKPQCRKSPCQEKGSWVTPGYRFSQSFSGLDIPSEASCPYSSESLSGNETQVPLKDNCYSGAVKVESFKETRTLAEAVETLKQNIPLIMAAKLSWNFYKNEGLVTLSESEQPAPNELDYHSLGHAFLAVGVMELPEKIHKEEGNFCILVANSWGKGWGAGGYACLTEKWLQKYRQNSAFVAVTKVRVR
ncbi:MAG: C1 family peptidase [Bacteriovoracia bacterium]